VKYLVDSNKAAELLKLYEMTVVTRNVRHIAPTGVAHLNSFEPVADLKRAAGRQ
jgi:hypothetical protein